MFQCFNLIFRYNQIFYSNMSNFYLIQLFIKLCLYIEYTLQLTSILISKRVFIWGCCRQRSSVARLISKFDFISGLPPSAPLFYKFYLFRVKFIAYFWKSWAGISKFFSNSKLINHLYEDNFLEIKRAKKKVYRSVLHKWPPSQNLYTWKLLRILYGDILRL